MEYEYGNIMLEDGDIESLDEWSDDKEVAEEAVDNMDNALDAFDEVIDSISEAIG